MASRLLIRRRVSIHSRRLIGWIAAVFSPARQLAWAPVDRRAHPAQPTAVVVLDNQIPAVLAGSGRHLFASGRKRYATASDVVWLTPNRLAAVYLLTSTIAVFDVDDSSGAPVATLRGQVSGQPGIEMASSIAAAPDGTWVAVTNSSAGSVSVLSLDDGVGDISVTVLATVAHPADRNVHGLAVTPDGRFIAFTSIDEPGGVRMASVSAGDGDIAVRVDSTVVTAQSPLRPKGIRFAPDGRFVVLAYGCNVDRTRMRLQPGFVEVRRFEMESGTIGDVVSRTGPALRLGAGESVAFLPDGSGVVVTDQIHSTAQVIEFDRQTGQLGAVTMHIGWTAGGLSFPHGCSVSPDQRWIAITNYGDGSIRFFAAPVSSVSTAP